MLADPLQFLKSHPSELRNIRSKEEALQIFLQSNPSLISHIHIRQTRADIPVKIKIPSDVQEAITQIMAGLVALEAIRETATPDTESHSGHHAENFKPFQPAQYQWMTDNPIYEKLTTVKIVDEALASLQSAPDTTIQASDQHYRQFEQYFETQFPPSAESPISWSSLLKEQGLQGIQNKLETFRPPLQSSPDTVQPPPQDIARYRDHYVRSRVIPHLQAHVHYEVKALQSEAYQILLTQPPIITQWQEQEKERSTIARLCGSWLWTLHNHQNHQDHKMTVHFVPPGEPSPPNQPIPNSVVLHGDTVYVEWVFPQGKQEDSLLLSNRDSIMEGTFQNTLGPYGSITGKRLSSCKP